MLARFHARAFELIFTLALLAVIAPLSVAHAYIGPALGLGVLGAGFGVLMTSASAVFYLFALTVRRAFKRVIGFFAPTRSAGADEAAARQPE
ncbi:MAG TPA: hypothetical protein VM689_14005 [Aliidongia sp.]|nr:hypothetical protein [Aliidongia sp.]